MILPSECQRAPPSHFGLTDFVYRFGKKMCRIFVGDDPEPYTVHHDLITASSEFFNRALNGQFKEKDGDVKLPEQKTGTFGTYHKWLYTDKLELDASAPVYDVVLELYFLGDQIQDERLQNSVIDFIIKSVSVKGRYPLSSRQVTLVFDNTPKNSSLRKLVIDFWACRATCAWYQLEDCQGEDGQYPSEFLYGVLKVSASRPGPFTMKNNPWVN